jgi:UDP-2,4-diacetamido-2,4,6-trideoxy-beta-L-altropyranose hydrolase
LQRVFVFFGGSDPTNETMKVLRAISELNVEDFAVDVLVGLSNPYRSEIERFASKLPGVVLRQYTDQISELMLGADLAIGAGGATSWERCCLGLPSITIAVADNQELLSQTLANHGYQHYLGPSRNVTLEAIANAIENSVHRFADTVAMGLNCMSLVDGNGADRVVAAMRGL